VHAVNFVRAETDMYFAGTVRASGGIGRLRHTRDLTPIDRQTVVRMNRDTLYSSGVFDLDAGAVTVVLPDAGARFQSLQVVSQDHYVSGVAYGPSRTTWDRAKVGTRYMQLIVRTFADARDPADLEAARRAQDGVRIEQAAAGRLELPEWDAASRDRTRRLLEALGSLGGMEAGAFGRKEDVHPIAHLLGTARGWGGNPPEAATYVSVTPAANDGRTVHRLVVRDVPVDGFWSVTVYDDKGFLAPNAQEAYSLNGRTAQKGADGTIAIQFGGCSAGMANCLPVTPGWNYTVRLYRPRAEILSGQWQFPRARPAP
jgi:para-nitrobenzyl esterase